MYTSTFDEKKVTDEQKEVADRVEQELMQDPTSKNMQSLEEGGDRNDELNYSSVLREEEPLASKHKGTELNNIDDELDEHRPECAQNAGQYAQPQTTTDLKQNQESMQLFKKGLMSKVQSKKPKDDLAQNTAVLQSFKQQVLNKLSPPSKSSKVGEE